MLLLLLFATPAAAMDWALGLESAATTSGGAVTSVVLVGEFDYPADYHAFQMLELGVTASKGRWRDEEERIDVTPYRRDLLRYGWGWESRRELDMRYRIGTVIALEQPDHLPGGRGLTAGAFGGIGMEWQRRVRAEVLFDTTRHAAAMLSIAF